MPDKVTQQELDDVLKEVSARRVVTSRGKVTLAVRMRRNKVLLTRVDDNVKLAFPGTVSQRGQA